MKRITTLMVAPALALATAQSQAQENDALEGDADTPHSVRVGAAILSHSNTSNATGRGGFLLGLSRDISERGRIDLDFSRQSRGGNKVQAGGISYVHRFPLSAANNKLYAGLGVGVYRVSAEVTGSGVAFSDSKVRIGGKVLVGYNFNKRFFSEAGYTKTGKAAGAEASHFSVVIGIKF